MKWEICQTVSSTFSCIAGDNSQIVEFIILSPLPFFCESSHLIHKALLAHHVLALLRKPLFEMCWFYMVIDQIALDPPPSQDGQT